MWPSSSSSYARARRARAPAPPPGSAPSLFAMIYAAAFGFFAGASSAWPSPQRRQRWPPPSGGSVDHVRARRTGRSSSRRSPLDLFRLGVGVTVDVVAPCLQRLHEVVAVLRDRLAEAHKHGLDAVRARPQELAVVPAFGPFFSSFACIFFNSPRRASTSVVAIVVPRFPGWFVYEIAVRARERETPPRRRHLAGLPRSLGAWPLLSAFAASRSSARWRFISAAAARRSRTPPDLAPPRGLRRLAATLRHSASLDDLDALPRLGEGERGVERLLGGESVGAEDVALDVVARRVASCPGRGRWRSAQRASSSPRGRSR